MKSIAVFNNKGGVGKSTLTLLMADFFSSTKVTVGNRRARILVVDLDAQNSSTTALHGQSRVADKVKHGLTVGGLVECLLRNDQPSLTDYLTARIPGNTGVRKIPLGKLWTMVSDGDTALRIEEKYQDKVTGAMVETLKPALAKEFDIVLFDLPANIDRRNYIPMAALAASDYIVTPTEPSKITINAMARTFDIIRDVQGSARQRGYAVPKIVGVVLNKTDKRTKQYRLHAKEINLMAGQHDSLVFTAFLPNAPTLATASDDSLKFETLRERYDTYYDHVRKVAKELASRCGYAVTKKAPATQTAAAG